jgi:hypothetical protein
MATAKKASAKSAAKTGASAKEVDDLLGTGGEAAADVLEGKSSKKAGKAAAPAKKAAAEKPAAKKAKPAAKETTGTPEDIRAVLLKTAKLTSYADVAEANGFDIRAVRRTARALCDSGEVERVKEGTVVFVKRIAKGK